MNIGEAARACGVSAKMIRHYEALGLLAPAARSEAGYRRYGEEALQRLRFIRRARELGFSLAAIAELVSLWNNPGRTSAAVKALATHHLAELDARIAALGAMRDALAPLAAACEGSANPGCPILDGLQDAASSAPPGGRLTPQK